MSLPESFQCYLVQRDASDVVNGSIVDQPFASLPVEGEITIRVGWSSANYKDALAAKGHPGVARTLPHVPGIDAVGQVVDIADNLTGDVKFTLGQDVIVTGYELGAGWWGGWSEYIRVPGEWVIPLPPGLAPEIAMSYGTAGFTAAQGVDHLLHNRLQPAQGEIVVTGATGGVGSVAVKLLSNLGFSVTAVTGKQDQHDWLRQLGAKQVLSREQLREQTGPKPLGKSLWQGAIDTVGGDTLVSLLKSTAPHGCVAACGMVGGNELATNVFPFILRGVTLAGITASLCTRETRLDIWNKLATSWQIDEISEMTTCIQLSEVSSVVEQLLAGQARGRTLVQITR